jgi:hypothetical protein
MRNSSHKRTVTISRNLKDGEILHFRKTFESTCGCFTSAQLTTHCKQPASQPSSDCVNSFLSMRKTFLGLHRRCRDWLAVALQEPLLLSVGRSINQSLGT